MRNGESGRVVNVKRGMGVVIAAVGLTAAMSVAPAGGATGSIPKAAIWVSPTGSGHHCSKTRPCKLGTGFQTLAIGGTLVMKPGGYGSTSHPVTEPLMAGTKTLVEGEPGKPMPVLHSAAPAGIEGWDISRVRVDFTGGDGGIVAGHLLSHSIVIATTSDPNSGACVVHDASIVDSLCVNASGNGIALDVEVTTKPVHVDGTTAVDTVSSGIGVLLSEVEANTSGTVTMANDIALGTEDNGGVSAYPPQDGVNQNITVTMEHSDSNDLEETADGGGTGILNTDSSDIKTPPVFVDAAAENFRETASSPTVNRGEPVNGHGTDLAGLPRTLGLAPDMGAYEFPEKPAISHVKVKSHTSDSITIGCRINPNGLAAIARARLVKPGSGKLPKGVKITHVTVTGDSGTRVTLKLTGLKLHHHYRLVVVAHNRAGTTKSSVVHASS